MLCNFLIQPHFDFTCCDGSMSPKNKLEAAQRGCIRFCLIIQRRCCIGLNHFEKIIWIPAKNRVDQCIVVMAYNFKNNLSTVYMSDRYTINFFPVVKTKGSVDSFVGQIYLKEMSRKSISYLETKIWNNSDRNIKTFTSTNSFKHALKNNV